MYLTVIPFDPAEGVYIGVRYYKHTPGTYSRNATSDIDFYGCTESDWEFINELGQPLELVSLSATLSLDVEDLIFNHMESKNEH